MSVFLSSKDVKTVFFILMVCCIFSCARENKITNPDINGGLGLKKIFHYKKRINNASLLFENEVYDFKKIKRNNRISTFFKFKNTSKYPLLIYDIQTSCGCTVSKWSNKIIKPNQSSAIMVLYDAGDHSRFLKSITVFYNGKNSPKLLYIKGEVVSPKKKEN